MRWNCKSKALRFLQITAKNLRFSCSYRISNNKNFIPKYLDNALKVLLKLHKHRGDRIGERKFLWTILWGSRAGNHCWSKIGNWRGKSFCCYDNFDVIATPMMTNFHLNTTMVAIFPNVCLWRRSLCSDLVLTLKNCIEPPSYARTAYVVAIWPSFLFDSFVKIGQLARFFGANGLPPPLAKNFPYAYVQEYVVRCLSTFCNTSIGIRLTEKMLQITNFWLSFTIQNVLRIYTWGQSFM